MLVIQQRRVPIGELLGVLPWRRWLAGESCMPTTPTPFFSFQLVLLEHLSWHSSL